MNDTFEQVCAEMVESESLISFRDRISAIYKRDMAKKDSEIENWRKQSLEENAALDVTRGEIETRDALIREMLKALQEDVECPEYGVDRTHVKELIAKAKEIV